MAEKRNEYFEKALKTPTKKKPAPFIDMKENTSYCWKVFKYLLVFGVILVWAICYFQLLDNIFLSPPLMGKYINFRTSIACRSKFEYLDSGSGFCVPMNNDTVKHSYYLGIFLSRHLHEPSFRKYCLGENLVVMKSENELQYILASSGGIGSLYDEGVDGSGILTPEKLNDRLELQKSFEMMLRIWKVEKRWEIDFERVGEDIMLFSSRYGKSKLQCLKDVEHLFNNFIFGVFKLLMKPYEYFKIHSADG